MGAGVRRYRSLEVELEVHHLAQVYGLERLGFLTFTFAENVQEVSEAARRFNELNSHALRGRYATWLLVVERQRSGRVHLHLAVVCPVDIRSGFDFEAVKQRDYRSACSWLRDEWRFWRQTAPRYGFGRSELKPIRTDARRFGAYLGSYLVKQYGTRLAKDAGAQLVRYARNFPHCVYGDFRPLLRGQQIEDRRLALEIFWGVSLRHGISPRIGRAWRTLEVLPLPWITEAEAAEEGLNAWHVWFGNWAWPRWGRRYCQVLRYGYSRGFERLLRCDRFTFEEIVRSVAEQRSLYGGLEFAIEEAWADWDRAGLV